jgi:hypothetical protein
MKECRVEPHGGLVQELYDETPAETGSSSSDSDSESNIGSDDSDTDSDN